MAQMETDGIEEAIRQLNKADLFTDENVKRMLTAGSEVMLTSVKSAFAAAIVDCRDAISFLLLICSFIRFLFIIEPMVSDTNTSACWLI